MNQDHSPTTLHKRFYCPYPQVHALEKKLQNKITDILLITNCQCDGKPGFI